MMKRILTSAVLVPVMSLGLYAAPALADSTTIKVKNNNDANVTNNVVTVANTGKNDANGGYGDGAGSGGSVSYSDDNNTGGNGGNGGNGGDGGIILTGNAKAKSVVINKVNTNVTEIDPCGCDSDGAYIKVKNNNSANVTNNVVTVANTGKNDANGGGAGGGGGDGGDVSNSDDENIGGDGGNAGHGGWGGYINTGDAKAKTVVVNRVNKNITRIP